MKNRFALLALVLAAASANAQEGLLDIYERALINDPAIREAEANLMANSEVKRQARSGLLPTLSLSGSASDSYSLNPNPPLDFQTGIPDFLGPQLYTKPCIYTMPPDRGFVIDTLPEFPQVSVVIGAGHAYKFASLIGLILSELAIQGQSSYDISAFSLSRPAITDPKFHSLLKLAG